MPGMERFETFAISGMHCESCVKSIDKAVRSLRGVLDAEVDLSSGEVHVTFDPEHIDAEDIIEVISGLGYAVSLSEEEGEHLH